MISQKIRQKTVVEQVMENIKSLLSNGKYQPGDRIPTEQELAERFGIGRSSIREAIKIFNYLGVLESRTAKGTYVCDSNNISKEALTWSILMGNEDMYNLVDLRGAIELWSMFSLVDRIKKDPENGKKCLDTLASIIEEMKKAVAENQQQKLIKKDYDFHSVIIQESGNEVFISLFETLRSFMYEEIKKSYQPADLNTLPGNHQILLDAIKTGNRTEAMKAVMWHIDDTTEKLRK